MCIKSIQSALIASSQMFNAALERMREISHESIKGKCLQTIIVTRVFKIARPITMQKYP